MGETRYQLSLAKSESSVPTLSLEPSSKIKPIYSIDAWTSAFQIFVGVHTSKFPQEAPDIMKYSEVVRNLAARGANWRFYDTQLRSLRQTRAHEMPWGTTHFELWIRAQSFAHIAPARSNIAQPSGRTSQLGPFVPIGSCRAFHKGVKCTGCSYKHNCFKCGAAHSAKSCNFRTSSRTTIENQQQVCALTTPIKIDRLLPLLQGYVVKLVLMLFEGFTYGFLFTLRVVTPLFVQKT